MDIFLYKVAVEQLHNCKTVKDIEELVRKWEKETKSISVYGSSVGYNDIKFKYKLLTLAINLYTTKSKKALPRSIYSTQINLQRDILKRLSNKSFPIPLLNLEEFIDFFEFDSIVETPYSSTCFLTILHNIILDKPVHFKFKFNQELDWFDQYSTRHMIPDNIKKYLYAIRLKRTLSPNTPSTVLDQYLAETLANIPKHIDVSDGILLLQQHTAALQTYQSTHGVLANEQS